MNHTPGPWMVWQSKQDNSLNVAAVKDRAFICEVGKIAEDDSDADTIRADARLIAAAPELLAALALFVAAEESFLASVKPGVIDDHLTDAYGAAKKAINKAGRVAKSQTLATTAVVSEQA